MSGFGTSRDTEFPKSGILAELMTYLKDHFPTHRNLELAVRVLECWIFIEQNPDLIREALEHPDAYVDSHTDREKGVLRAPNGMSFHLFSYKTATEALESFGRVLSALCAQATLLMRPSALPIAFQFISKIQDSEVGCLEARTSPALAYLADPVLTLQDLTETFFADKSEAMKSSPFWVESWIHFMAPYIGQHIRLLDGSSHILTYALGKQGIQEIGYVSLEEWSTWNRQMIFLLSTQIRPEKETRDPETSTWKYSYSDRENIQDQLSLTQYLLELADPSIYEVSIREELPDGYAFVLSEDQHQAIAAIREEQRLMKQIALGQKCFIYELCESLTRYPGQEPLSIEEKERRKVRAQDSQSVFIVLGDGVFHRLNKPRPRDYVNLKLSYSSPHATSLTGPGLYPQPIYGQHGAGISVSFDESIISRFMGKAHGGSVARPYAFPNKLLAEDYYSASVGKTFHRNHLEAFSQYQSHIAEGNEVQARMSWNPLSSCIYVFSGDTKSILTGVMYSHILRDELNISYAAQGKFLPKDYQVPLVFYCPGSPLIHLKRISPEEIESALIEGQIGSEDITSDHFIYLTAATDPVAALTKKNAIVGNPVFSSLWERGEYSIIRYCLNRSKTLQTLPEFLSSLPLSINPRKEWLFATARQREWKELLLLLKDRGISFSLSFIDELYTYGQYSVLAYLQSKCDVVLSEEIEKAVLIYQALNEKSLEQSLSLIQKTGNCNPVILSAIQQCQYSFLKGLFNRGLRLQCDEKLTASVEKLPALNRDQYQWLNQMGYDLVRMSRFDRPEGTRTLKSLDIQGLNLNIKNPEMTRVYIACIEADLETLSLLLEMGADPNISLESSGFSPLHVAVKKNNYAMAELLIRYGADKTSVNKKGEIPIDLIRGDSPLENLHFFNLLQPEKINFIDRTRFLLKEFFIPGEIPTFLLLESWINSLSQYLGQPLLSTEMAHTDEKITYQNAKKIMCEQSDIPLEYWSKIEAELSYLLIARIAPNERILNSSTGKICYVYKNLETAALALHRLQYLIGDVHSELYDITVEDKEKTGTFEISAVHEHALLTLQQSQNRKIQPLCFRGGSIDRIADRLFPPTSNSSMTRWPKQPLSSVLPDQTREVSLSYWDKTQPSGAGSASGGSGGGKFDFQWSFLSSCIVISSDNTYSLLIAFLYKALLEEKLKKTNPTINPGYEIPVVFQPPCPGSLSFCVSAKKIETALESSRSEILKSDGLKFALTVCDYWPILMNPKDPTNLYEPMIEDQSWATLAWKEGLYDLIRYRLFKANNLDLVRFLQTLPIESFEGSLYKAVYGACFQPEICKLLGIFKSKGLVLNCLDETGSSVMFNLYQQGHHKSVYAFIRLEENCDLLSLEAIARNDQKLLDKIAFNLSPLSMTDPITERKVKELLSRELSVTQYQSLINLGINILESFLTKSPAHLKSVLLSNLQGLLLNEIYGNITLLYSLCLSESPDLDLIFLLLEKGADPNLPELESRYTPLHVAARKENIDLINILLFKGANKSARSANGKTPYEMVRSGNPTILALLSDDAALADAGDSKRRRVEHEDPGPAAF